MTPKPDTDAASKPIEPEPVIDDQHPAKENWMHTSTGGKFTPSDPRAEDINISDIANGLAQDIRYGGQGDINRPYTVAEHSVHLALYALHQLKWEPKMVLAVLLHDAPEAYINDLPISVKREAGWGYKDMERKIERVLLVKYGVWSVSLVLTGLIKDMDKRIVRQEKEAIMRNVQPWLADSYEPLPGIKIQCWSPRDAKVQFLRVYEFLCDQDDTILREEWEI